MAKHRRQTTRLHAGLAAAITALVATTGAALFGGSPNPAPVADPGVLSVQQECQQALTYPSRSNADKTWLRQCVHALATPPVPSPTVAPTPTASPTQSPTPAPTTPSATPTAAPTPTPTPPPAGCTGQANPACTGVPVGWQPTETIFGDWNIALPGTYSGRRVYGDIQVKVDNVTITQTEVIGGLINNRDVRCHNGLALDQVSIVQSVPYNNGGSVGVVGPGGYTARRLKVLDRTEGPRVGGKSDGGCGPVVIEDSFIRITPPQPCPLDSEGNSDWHGDGIQGYDGPALTVTNVTIDFHEEGCGGTAAFYYVGGTSGNTSVDINGLTVKGGGFPFRLGTPGAVRNVHVVDGSWHWGPTDITVACSLLVPYQVDVVRVDAAWQTTAVVRTLPC